LHKTYLNVVAVEWRRWRRRYTVSTVAMATDGVESGGDLESFGMKNEMTQGGLLFISSKTSAAVLV
jgi:hypothetical protein